MTQYSHFNDIAGRSHEKLQKKGAHPGDQKNNEAEFSRSLYRKSGDAGSSCQQERQRRAVNLQETDGIEKQLSAVNESLEKAQNDLNEKFAKLHDNVRKGRIIEKVEHGQNVSPTRSELASLSSWIDDLEQMKAFITKASQEESTSDYYTKVPVIDAMLQARETEENVSQNVSSTRAQFNEVRRYYGTVKLIFNEHHKALLDGYQSETQNKPERISSYTGDLQKVEDLLKQANNDAGIGGTDDGRIVTDEKALKWVEDLEAMQSFLKKYEPVEGKLVEDNPVMNRPAMSIEEAYARNPLVDDILLTRKIAQNPEPSQTAFAKLTKFLKRKDVIDGLVSRGEVTYAALPGRQELEAILAWRQKESSAAFLEHEEAKSRYPALIDVMKDFNQAKHRYHSDDYRSDSENIRAELARENEFKPLSTYYSELNSDESNSFKLYHQGSDMEGGGS